METKNFISHNIKQRDKGKLNKELGVVLYRYETWTLDGVLRFCARVGGGG